MAQRRSLISAVTVFVLLGILAVSYMVTVGAKGYTPQTRTFNIVGQPGLVHEMQDTLPYLQKDFAPGGVLDGKEIYSFVPSTLVVYQGDTVTLNLLNPADDSHTFTIPDLNVNIEMPGTSTATGTFVATKVGIFTFICDEPEHSPYMWGQLVVLPNSQS